MTPDTYTPLLRAGIDVRADAVTRTLYSTDASIYQIEPLAVAFPRHVDEISAIVEFAAAQRIAVLPRGAGSSLAGQAVGAALILDLSRHLDQLIHLDPQARTARVQPGLILANLNKAAAVHGLQFGPDPASAERATLGGSLANNASGAHALTYGMAADHLLAAEVTLADGSTARFAAHSHNEASQIAQGSSLEAALYRFALNLRANHSQTIRDHFPKLWRRASGYNLNYLLPYAPSAPPNWQAHFNPHAIYNPIEQPASLNLAPVLAGSEGTLAIFRELTVSLVPKPRHTLVCLLIYDDIAAACDDTPRLLALNPSAIELLPGDLLRLARSIPAYANRFNIIPGNPEAVLLLEFSGDDPRPLRAIAERHLPNAILAETAAQQKQLWEARKVGLGILMSAPGEAKPQAFIEDLTVPVERLGEYVRAMQHIFAAHGTHGMFYAHASSGCLHVRPLVSLKTAHGRASLRAIAEAAIELVIGLGGVVSGEHGDGLARSEWMERQFGREMMAMFCELKDTADPQGILNPGKIVRAPKMDANLRSQVFAEPEGWGVSLSFARQGGIGGAVEMCNGAGVCRKADGVMCPSFQATRDEMHSTRGRANLLRALLTGQFPLGLLPEKAASDALDLCLACKGCKAECPSGVDMAKLKYVFLQHKYRTQPRRLRDYLFGYIGILARVGAPFHPLVRWGMGSAPFKFAMRRMGIHPARALPLPSPPAPYHPRRGLPKGEGSPSPPAPYHPRRGLPKGEGGEEILFLPDTFTRYFEPEIETAARSLLVCAGIEVIALPVHGAGRTLLSKGFVDAAKAHAARLLKAIRQRDPEGTLPIIGLEPSEIYTLRDEFLDFFPEDAYVQALARRAWLWEEYLLRAPHGEPSPLMRIVTALPEEIRRQHAQTPLLLHGHCYQKAQPPAEDGLPVGVAATAEVLRAVGYPVEIVDSGCCGMAGAFGYETEHYDLSIQVGELALFPKVRAHPEKTVIAPGTSCRAQIHDGTGRAAQHPASLIQSRR